MFVDLIKADTKTFQATTADEYLEWASISSGTALTAKYLAALTPSGKRPRPQFLDLAGKLIRLQSDTAGVTKDEKEGGE